MRLVFLYGCLHFFSAAFPQKGNELLVYSLKGNVTVVENNKESKLKIGKVIKPGSTIKTQRDAKLTMVCKEGKPLSITRQGDFPVELWKDSCAGSHASVTSKYFQYIWDQLYSRSDDYKRDHPEGTSISEAPVRGQDEKEILFNDWMDTVNYATGFFPLLWTTSFEYNGRYDFMLTDIKTKKQVYRDSSTANTRALDKLKKYLKPGNSYSWSVTTKETGLADGGVVNCLSVKTVSQQILSLRKNMEVPEELAAQYFRVAYLLQEDRYMADAYFYFRKAAATDPSTPFYTEILQEFKAKCSID